MSIRKCPRCGLPIGNREVCPMCGVQAEEREPEQKQIRLHGPLQVHLGVWEIWLYDYIVPCDLIAACLVFLCMTAHKSVPLRSVLLSLITLFPHALVGLVLALCGVTAHGRAALVLTCIDFGCDLLSIPNLLVIYFVKYRNSVVETFRLWE